MTQSILQLLSSVSINLTKILRRRLVLTLLKSVLPSNVYIFLRQLLFKITNLSTARRLVFQDSGNHLDNSYYDNSELVSIVLPVYNQIEYLSKAIDSILNQSYRNFELIIVNDGSTTDVQGLVLPYLKDSRVKYYEQSNFGLPHALNEGFRVASGRYFTWISADNLFMENAIHELVSFLQNHPLTLMVYGDYAIIDAEDNRITKSNFRIHNQDTFDNSIMRLPSKGQLFELLPDNFIGPLFMYRATVYETIGGYANVPGIEDYDYWLRIRHLGSISHLNNLEPLYLYRVHKETMSERFQELKIPDNLKLLHEVAATRQNLSPQFLESLCGRKAMNAWSAKPVIKELGRIAIVVGRFGTGGVENMILELSSELKNLNVEVRIFSMLLDSAQNNHSDLVTLCYSSTDMLEKVSAFNPTIVNAHDLLNLAHFIENCSFPLLNTLHNSYVWLSEDEISKMSYLASKARINIAVSNQVKKWAIEVLGIDEQVVSIVPNGVNFIPDLESHLSYSFEYILCASTISTHKRQLQVIRSFGELRAEFPDLHLVLIGYRADSHYEGLLSKEIVKLKLRDVVHYEGLLENPIPVIRGAKALVQPSLYEGSSLTIIEAAQNNVPIVTTRVGDWNRIKRYAKLNEIENVPKHSFEITQNNLFGLAVDPGRRFQNDLTDAIRFSLTDKTKSTADINIVREALSATRSAALFVEVCRNLIRELNEKERYE